MIAGVKSQVGSNLLLHPFDQVNGGMSDDGGGSEVELAIGEALRGPLDLILDGVEVFKEAKQGMQSRNRSHRRPHRYRASSKLVWFSEIGRRHPRRSLGIPRRCPPF